MEALFFSHSMSSLLDMASERAYLLKRNEDFLSGE